MRNVNITTIIKSRDMQLVEQKYGKPLDDVIRGLHKELKSIPAVADRLGVKRQTLWKWCQQLGLTDLPRKYERKNGSHS